MFYVSLSLGAVFVYDADDHFHLVGLAIDADGVVTVTLGADNLAASKATYGPYCIMSMDEVIAKFAITPTTPMKPKALVLLVPAEETVFLDQTTTGAKATTVIDMVALTGGTFTCTPTSSATGKCTVAAVGETITYTPVAEGSTNITLTIEDSENVYADAVFVYPVTVAKRDLVFTPIDDQEATAGGAAVNIDLETEGFDNVITTVDVYSTDNEIVAVTYADDATNAKVGTITCTPHATQKGEVTVIVKGADSAADNGSAELSFQFRVK